MMRTLFRSPPAATGDRMHADCLIEDLSQRTITSMEDWHAINDCNRHDFIGALEFLAAQGLTAHHVQWLVEKPFAEFGEYEFDAVMILAMSLNRGTTTVAQLHEGLRAREFWAKLHGETTFFPPTALPSVFQINEALGLAPSSREVLPTPLAFAVGCCEPRDRREVWIS